MTVTRSNKRHLIFPSKDARDGSYDEMNSTVGNFLLTLPELNEAERVDTLGNKICRYVGLPNTAFKNDEDGISIRKASTDGVILKVVLT